MILDAGEFLIELYLTTTILVEKEDIFEESS